MNAEPADKSNCTLWSIVIPTYQRPQLLNKALSSCLTLSTPKGSCYEVVVVDNSQDGSAASVCDAFADKRIRFIHEPRSGLAYARNAGINAALGNFLIFLDDDERVAPDWLLQFHEAFKESKADIVFGSVEPEFEDQRAATNKYVAAFYRRYLTLAPYGDASHLLDYAGTGNSAYLYQRCFGSGIRVNSRFNLTGGEDIELFRTLKKAGCCFAWAPNACAYEWVSNERSSWVYLKTRRRAQGENRVNGLWRQATLASRFKIIPFMIGGLLQALCHLALYAAARIAGRDQRANEHAVEIQGGLGKLLWTRAGRQHHYGR